MNYAKDYSISRAVMYDDSIDASNPMFDLNRDIISGQGDVTIITQENYVDLIPKIMAGKGKIQSQSSIQKNLFDNQ